MTTEDGDIAALKDSLRRMLGAQYSPEDRRRLLVADRGLEQASWQALTGQLGLGALGVPEQYEGVGGTPEQSQIVHEELGAVLYSGPYLASNGLAVPALLCAGDEDARSQHLPLIAEGAEIATLATTEAGRSWDITDIETVAQPDGGGWLLTGSKSYVLDALDAGTILVSAISLDGIGLFAVALPNEAVTMTPTPSMDLTHRLCRVDFDHASATRVSGSGDATQAL
ncbi:MAG: acyl-CoA/acyl-ACP dehydrogenase, partial [bacterium]|nr:acyl-CoA/acyl-ACP dehydrogenase [bacterium]